MAKVEGRARRKAAREKYKPSPIRCLLVAEAPPSDDRYFYFEDVRAKDKLFVHTMKVLFPKQLDGYVGGRSRGQKAELLRQFQRCGFWLIDSLEDPIPTGHKATAKYLLQRSDLLERLRRLKEVGDIGRTTPIVLVKATVYDAFFGPLVAAGHSVIDERIYFPSTSREPEFESGFSRALELLT